MGASRPSRSSALRPESHSGAERNGEGKGGGEIKGEEKEGKGEEGKKRYGKGKKGEKGGKRESAPALLEPPPGPAEELRVGAEPGCLLKDNVRLLPWRGYFQLRFASFI